jgi:hypothetical protein
VSLLVCFAVARPSIELSDDPLEEIDRFRPAYEASDFSIISKS